MTDDAENMSLMSLIVNGVAHGLAIDGERGIGLGIGFVPALEGLVEEEGVDADEDLTEGGDTGDDITAFDIGATEAFSGLLAQGLGPIEEGLVAAHATEGGTDGKGQDGGEAMASALGSARIGDLSEEGGKVLHMLSSKFHVSTSCQIGGRKGRLG